MYDRNAMYRKIGLQFFAEPAEGGGNDGGEGNQNPPAKSFSQEQVNSMMANEKRTARTALLKELGYELKEGEKLSDVIGTIKGILDSGKTQQQKDQEARETAEKGLTEERAKVNNLQAQLDVLKAGVKPDYVEDAITMLLPKVTEEKPLAKLLEEYKSKYPNWFTDSGNNDGSKGTGGPNNPPNKGGKTEGLGKRLAQGHKQPAKSSYFTKT